MSVAAKRVARTVLSLQRQMHATVDEVITACETEDSEAG